MPDAATLQRLSAAVDAGFAAQVAFLQELVRFPSRRGEEAPLQDWMAREFARRGYAVDRYTLADVALPAHEKGAPMVGVDPDSNAALASSLRSDGERSEYMAAVTAAPAPAPAAAKSAMLVLDMLGKRRRRGKGFPL